MKVAVVGLGSMGKRRIRLMQEIDPSLEILGIDGREDRRAEAKDLYGIETADSTEGLAAAGVECAFVCTAPLSHNEIIRACLSQGLHVFTELNLVADGYEENQKLAEDKNVTLFLSSTFLYREETSYICRKVAGEGNWNYVYHIGQYLPDWHPWESFQDFFVGNKRTNGCREIMAIELPWLTKAFGGVTKCTVTADKQSALPIDYKDNYMITLQHENGNKGVLVVDVVSPCAVRRFEGYKENQYIQWSGTPDTLLAYDAESKTLNPVVLQEQAEHKEGYRAFIVENAYRNEIKTFFAAVKGEAEPSYGFAQDAAVLQLIDQLEA